MTTTRKPEKPGQLLFEEIYRISTTARSDKPDRDYTCTLDQFRWDAFALALRSQEARQPVAWRYWKDKFACWEYSDVKLEFPAVPADTQMHPLYE